MVASGGRLRSRSLTAVRRSYLGRADQIALRLWEKAGIGTVFCLKKLVTLSQLCRRLQDGSIIICVLDTTRLIEVWIDETGRGAWFPGEGVDSVDLKQKPQLSPLSWRELRFCSSVSSSQLFAPQKRCYPLLRAQSSHWSQGKGRGDALGQRSRASC